MTNVKQEVHLQKILHVIQFAERLKREMRHSWLSDERRESVAEHGWRLAFMALLLAPALAEEVNIEKCLKMALVHDLAEAETGDKVTSEVNTPELLAQKFEQEKQAMQHIQSLLGSPLGDELFMLWMEFEARQSYEARFIRALGNLEVQLQHNQANINTWLHIEKLMIFQPQWMEAPCQFDPLLDAWRLMIKDQAVQKLIRNGDQPENLRDEVLA